MTKTFHIGVDIDDVLHPWYLTAHGICEAAGITNGVTPKTWRMHEEYGCDVELWAKVLDQAADGLYNVPPIPGAAEALRRLSWAGHTITLVTARGMGVWQTTEQRLAIHRWTFEWAREYAVPFDNLIFDADKARVADHVGLQFFVDDSVTNFQALELGAPKTESYLMSAPHNVDFYTPFRVNSMDEFAEIIERKAA